MVAAVAVAGCGDRQPRRMLNAVQLDSTPVVEVLGKPVVHSGALDAWLRRDPLDLRLDHVTREGVTVRDVVARRRGATAFAEATVDPAQLAALAPGGVDLRYDPRASGDGITLRGTARVLGLEVPVTVRVLAQDGAVVAIPDGLPIGRQVLFTDPRVSVRRLTARPEGDALRVHVDAQVAAPA